MLSRLLTIAFFSAALLSAISPAAEGTGPGSWASCLNGKLDSLGVDSDEWKRVSVRDPSQPLIDALYLKRLHQALHTVFEPWFFGKTKQSYMEMLRAQQIASTTDESGAAFYLGASFRKEGKNFVKPGTFVFEAETWQGRPVKLREDRFGVNTWRKIRDFLDPEAAAGLTRILKRMSDEKFNSAETFEYHPDLPRLGKTSLMLNKVNLKDGTVLSLKPVFGDVPKFIEAMGKIMDDIRKVPKGTNNARVVNLLSEYIYIGVNAHPFFGANYSTLMSHVNWVLRYHGMKGISHDKLDFTAFYMPFHDYSFYFRRDILNSNSHVDEPEKWLADFDADSEEFERISVRDPEAPLIDRGYLKRLHDSIRVVFAPWFGGIRGNNSIGYEDMMRRQHRILANGLDGQEVYQGASRIEVNRKRNYQVRGGVFRYDSPNRDHRVSFSFDINQKLAGAITPDLEAARNQYRSAASASETPSALDANGTAPPFVPKNGVVRTFEMPRVKGDVRVWNYVSEGLVTPVYPTNAQSKLFMEAMRSIMSDLRFMHRSPANTDRVVALASQYTYLASWAHLGTGGNFSLAMGQVEYVLNAWGVRGISHGSLDYLALSRSFRDYDYSFRSALIEANSADAETAKLITPGTPPVQTREWVPLSITGHISMIGDQQFSEGQYVGDWVKPYQLEGFSLSSDSLPKGVQLQYSTQMRGKGETPWLSDGEYSGTKGERRPIDALAIRLSGTSASDYTVMYQAHLASPNGPPVWLAPAADGEWIRNSDPQKIIIGMKVWIYKKTHD